MNLFRLFYILGMKCRKQIEKERITEQNLKKKHVMKISKNKNNLKVRDLF